MDNTRCLILLAFALSLLSIAFADCNASISPNLSIGIDFLSSDNPVDDETVVAEQLVKETNPEDVEKLLKSIENEPWFNEGFVDKEGSKACKEYSELDEKVVLEIEKGGKDRSSKQTKWARGRFDAWRRHFKKEFTVSPETPIEDIPLLQLNDMRFLLQVRKKDGSLFPPGSLNCLLKGIGRIVRKKQEVTVNLTGDLKEPPFNILRDLRFGKARLGFVAACDKARKEGVGVKKKKAAAIPFNTEKDLLADLDFQIHSPKGIQKRLCYFLVTRFAIRGGAELYECKDVDFTLEFDGSSEFLLYDERTSKNWGTTVTRFDESHFRPSIWTHEEDFILTYKQYVWHLPPKEIPGPRPFFLQPIPNFKGNIWFQKGRVGVNNLSSWVQSMGSTVDVQLSNKSGRVSTITRMSLAGVPPEIGKLVTGHRNTDSYHKYDRSKDIQVEAAMEINSKPYNDDGSLRLYKDVLCERIAAKEKFLLGSRSSKVLVPLETGNTGSGVVTGGSSSSEQEKTKIINVDDIGKSVANIGKSVANVPAGNCDISMSDSDDFTNEMLEELIEIAPNLRHYFPTKSLQLNNFGGQSFFGATFNNCTFVLPDSSARVPLLDKTNVISK